MDLNKYLRIGTRGVDPLDKRFFSEKEISRLKKAQEEVFWLLNRGYNMNSVINLIGNHYQFSLRQRQALRRSTSPEYSVNLRKSKLLSPSNLSHKKLHIDGFNLIITLEVAFSKGILIVGNDSVIRDIAGIQGSYRLIDKTDMALNSIIKTCKTLGLYEINFLLDSPVSNSGRLKERILKHFSKENFNVTVDLVPNADIFLYNLDNVVTSDSIILDKCKSWINLSNEIIVDNIPNANLIHLNTIPNL
ncbi:DUF434 domain-containing protein [Clostridium felsineum]|uniref:Uncharacterized protein n=1 Tax=Clostridium felsineum TaxID=36839 RepID=A0A1S8MCL3_9CLOT|nr:DUF434 domain-containing protein [Clostridium felsineum]URZ06893.1 hypothetical protein CLROS_022260 [Clostridium felsineum]URZ11925.1 hypothetical protein CROST_026420 [Clostridium felsineum]